MPVTLPETIVRRRCSALIPYARNARTHSDQQVAQIAASIREFGFTNPVLIDEEDGIIAGNGRVLAAHVLGLDEMPCIVLAHLTPTQRRAYVLAPLSPTGARLASDLLPQMRSQPLMKGFYVRPARQMRNFKLYFV